MPTRKTIVKQPTLDPALPPSDQSKDGSGNGDGGGIVPAPSTDGAAAIALNRPLPRIRKAKVYSSFGGGGLDGAFGGGGGGGGGGGTTRSTTTNDGSIFYENVVPPSAKKSRPNTMTTGIFEGIALPPTVVASTPSSASPTLAAAKTPGPVTKKRVTILDGTGYINGVQIGRIGSGSGNGGRGGPGSRCFDILDLNGARDSKNKPPPSLGRFAKTPGPLKSAAEIIPDDLTEESETTPRHSSRELGVLPQDSGRGPEQAEDRVLLIQRVEEENLVHCSSCQHRRWYRRRRG